MTMMTKTMMMVLVHSDDDDDADDDDDDDDDGDGGWSDGHLPANATSTSLATKHASLLAMQV